jgi:hypothetical protein
MKQMLVIALSAFLLAFYQLPKMPDTKVLVNNNAAGDSVFLSLYVVRTDETTHKSRGELLVFGKYANGKYTAVMDYDTSTWQPISERLPILKKHEAFDVYYFGQPISGIKVERIDTSTYDCMEIVVGCCENKITSEIIAQRSLEYSQGRSGSSDGQAINYSLTDFIALSGNYAKSVSPFSKQQKCDSLQSLLIDSDIKNKFKNYDSTLSKIVIERKTIIPISIAGEANPVFLTIALCPDTAREIIISLVSIYKFQSGKIETMMETFMDLEIGSWGNGYEFIDAIDIDSDHIPELFFRVDGYESSDIVIYKYKNGKFGLVLDAGMYGC